MDRDEVIRFYMEKGLSAEEAAERADQDVEAINRFLPNLHKVGTAKDIKRLNAIAVEREYNRAVTDEFLKKLDPDGWNMCTQPLLHTWKHFEPCEAHVRGLWLCKLRFEKKPVEVFIDMDAGYYMSLPEYDPETKVITKNPAPPGWGDLPPLRGTP